MEETVHYITIKTRQRRKTMANTDKDAVKGSFNLKTPRHNIMHNLFYSDTSKFSGNFQGMLDEVTYKKIHTKYAHNWL